MLSKIEWFRNIIVNIRYYAELTLDMLIGYFEEQDCLPLNKSSPRHLTMWILKSYFYVCINGFYFCMAFISAYSPSLSGCTFMSCYCQLI